MQDTDDYFSYKRLRDKYTSQGLVGINNVQKLKHSKLENMSNKNINLTGY